MADTTLQLYLSQHPMFQGMTDQHIDVLAGQASIEEVRPQQRIFKHDTRADHFYIVREGKVGLEVPAIAGEPLTIQTLSERKVLGWSWLIPPYRWLFDARAVTPSVVIALNGERLRAYCEADTKLGYELLKRFAALMAERLNAARLVAIQHHAGV